MTITLPEGITLPQESPLASLLGGLGTGIGAGAKQGSAYVLQKLLATQNAEQNYRAKLSQNMNKELKNRLPGLWENLPQDKKSEYEKDAKQLLASGMPIEDIVLEIDKLIKGPEPEQYPSFKEQMERAQGKYPEKRSFKEQLTSSREEHESLFDFLLDKSGDGSFARGVMSTETGKIQALSSGVSYSDYKKATELPEKASVWDHIKFSAGVLLGKAPSMAAGGAAGAAVGGAVASPTIAGTPIGGAIGGAAGAFAVPEMLDTALEEYMKYKESGGKASLEGFLESVAKVGDKGMFHGALGAMMPILKPLLPALKSASPAAKRFFETTKLPKLKEMIATSAIETTGLVGAEAVAKREKPTLESMGTTFAQVFGFNLFHAIPGLKKSITEKAGKSGIEPTAFAEKVKTKFEEMGGTEEGLKAKKAKDINLLNRSVNDITKEVSGKGTEISKTDLQKPGVWENKDLAIETIKTKENAEKLLDLYHEQLYESSKAITEAGGKSKAKTSDIMKAKDASNAMKMIESVKEELPSKKEFLEKQKVSPEEGLREKKAKDANLLNLAVNDITKETTQTAEKIKSKGKDTLGRNIPDWRNATVFHSTDSPESIRKNGFQILEEGQGGYYGKAVSFTPNWEYSQQFGTDVVKSKVSPDANILNLNSTKDWDKWQKLTKNKDINDFLKIATENGIDGVYDQGAGDLFIYNPEKIKVESISKNKPLKKARKVVKAEKKVPDVGKEALEKREVARKEYAEAIGREPVEEYITKPKMTKREKALYQERASTESKVKGLEKEITRYQKEVDKLKAYKGKERTAQREKTQGTLENLVEQRKASLKESKDRLTELAKEIKEAAPKPAKKMTAEEKQFYLDKHMKELKEMSDDPKGKVAEDWNRMFERDQKYQKQNEENMKRGKIPGAEYVGENIKILDRYVQEYEALKKLSHDRLKTAKGKEKAMLQRLLNNIDTNTKINRNKRAVWERYRSVKEAVRKPFIAKMLKDMGVNLGRHERVIFEAKKVLGKTEVKAQEAWNKYKKNPTKENLRQAAENSNMNADKVEKISDDIEEIITSDDLKISEEKIKEVAKNLDEAMEGDETSKEKAAKVKLTLTSLTSEALKKMGIKLSPNVIRNLLLMAGGSSFTTIRGTIRWAKRFYNVQSIRDMKKKKDYKGIDRMYRKHMKGGGTQATWNKWMKEAA